MTLISSAEENIALKTAIDSMVMVIDHEDTKESSLYNAGAVVMTFIPETIEELSLHVAAACRLDTTYNPQNDIKQFIETIPKPDVLIIFDNVVSSHTNNPESLGTIVVWDAMSKGPRINIGKVEPYSLEKGASDWIDTIREKNLNSRDFLETFIIKNT